MKNLEVGDYIIRYLDSLVTSIFRIERVTKTKAVGNGYELKRKYTNSDVSPFANIRYSRQSYKYVTLEEAKIISKKIKMDNISIKKKNQIADWLKGDDIHHENINAIHKLIFGDKNE